MRVWLRYISALLLSASAAQAGADDGRCPRGDVWNLSIGAEQALERGEWPEAARLYGCAARESDDAAVAERATRSAYENRQLERAVEAAKRWLELAPESEVARRYLATGLLRLYDEDAAAIQFAELLKTSYSDRARGYLVLLGILSAEGNDTGAARIMDGLAATDAGSPEAQYAASVLWQRADDGAKALAAADRAVALRADWPQAELARVRALATAGRDDEALTRSSELAAEVDPYLRISHAWLLLEQDRRDEAIALFEQLRRSGGPAAVDAAAALAALAIEDRRFDDATRFLDDVARDPEQADTLRWHLGRLAEERGRDTDAARQYQGIESGPRALTAQLRAYRLLRKQGAGALAEVLIDDYLAASPADTADVIAGVAAVLVEEGRGDEAIALVDRALTLMPDDGLLLARGFLLERLDRIPEAIADLRQVVARRPNDPMAQNALGYTLVDRTGSLEEGQRLIERALAAKPDSYAIQDSMGWALAQMGRLEDGKSWLETAWKRSEDPEVAAHLGETLWRMGREDEARRLWHEALADNPDSPPLLRAIERHPK
ncbi:MAG TPA: tetratricopeptide repeat protein [Steroidobacteraceae bacterium]